MRRSSARASLVSEAMRPARTTERWHRFMAGVRSKEMAQALAGVAILEAPGAEDEAEAIALILREVVETPGRTAALVTPDRELARRVAARLATWDLHVEDFGRAAAGPRPPVGAFLDLVIEAAATRLRAGGADGAAQASAVPARHGRGRAAPRLAHARARRLPHVLFRRGAGTASTPRWRRPRRTCAPASAAIAGVRRLGPDDWKAARKLVRRLGKALAPLEAAVRVLGQDAACATLVAAHIAAAEALGKPSRGGGRARRSGGGDAGEAASKFLASLSAEEATAPDMRAADYPAFYRSLAEEVTVRLRAPTHPRIFIWEPYESRLQHPDVVILGSLNEGTWPQAADPGPWLNRPMRQALGLPAPEERIGDAAHIFTSLLGVERVYLTRAAKIDGVPTVPSRWLLRLQALLAGVGGHGAARRPTGRGSPGRGSATRWPARRGPCAHPSPGPRWRCRPRQLSATTIERWIANPYAVFAERILGLEPLPALGRPLDAALRGQIVHEALGRFAQRFPDRLPEDICAELVALRQGGAGGALRLAARRGLLGAALRPLRRLVRRHRAARGAPACSRRWPRWRAPSCCQAQPAPSRSRRGPTASISATAASSSPTTRPATSRTLASRADAGPRAAAAAGGGHRHRRRVHGARTRRRSRACATSPRPAASRRARTCDLDDDVARLAREARDGLVRLIANFDNEATPYRALRRARFSYRYDAYAHLARVAEWSAETIEEA